MTYRLRFDLGIVLQMAEAAITASRRVDADNHIADTPPALHLLPDPRNTDGLYIDGNGHPTCDEHRLLARPFTFGTIGRHYGYGISWTEWTGNQPGLRRPVRARFALLDDSRLLDLIRAGHAAGFDTFTVDADNTGAPRPGVARRRRR